MNIQFIKSSLKRIGATALAGLCLITTTSSIITIANAYNKTSGTLGTNVALGSPLLNNQMQADDFNPWEQIAWGIYLSNYVNPFVDDYYSAFNQGAGYGSNGAGSQSLQFSSGSEATSAEIIKQMTSLAINLRGSAGMKQIKLTINDMQDGKITKSSVLDAGQQSSQAAPQPAESGSDGSDAQVDGSTDGSTDGGQADAQADLATGQDVQQATLADLFFMGNSTSLPVLDDLDEGDQNIWGVTIGQPVKTTKVKGDTIKIATAKEGKIPTFILPQDNGQGYKAIVLDYTDSYDVQQFEAAMVKAVNVGDAYSGTLWDEISEKADELGDLKQALNGYNLWLDIFGNICVQSSKNSERYYVVYPACLNQHLTETATINLVNSLVMNGTSVSSDQNRYVLYGSQLKSSNIADGNFMGITPLNNGDTALSTGAIAIGYDTDSYVAKNVIENGSFTASWGDALKAIFSADINNGQTNQVDVKLTLVNPDAYLGLKGDSGSIKSKLLRRQMVAAGMYSNQVGTTQNINNELQLLYDQTKSVSILGSTAAVSEMQATADHNKLTTVNATRTFVNFVYQTYKSNTDQTLVQYIEEVLNSASDNEDIWNGLIMKDNNPSPVLIAFWTKYAGPSGYWQTISQDAKSATCSWQFNEMFQKADVVIDPSNWTANGKKVATTSNISFKSQDMTTGFQTGNELFGRTFVVYTASDVVQKVAAALNCKSGADFEKYATDVYYTYLKFYGVLNDYGVSNGTDSKFNKNIFDESAISDLTKIKEMLGDGAYMTQEQKLNSIIDGTYTLLQRSLDRDYGITDFIYNQYYKMVYGRSQASTVTSNIQTRTANGFLQIHTFSENFLTAFFMNNYAQYSLYVMLILIVLIIIVAIIGSRGIWFCVQNIILTITILVMMPSVGELTPYLCNKMIENAFGNSMQYWQTNETLNNYNTEQAVDTQAFEGLDGEDLALAQGILKSHQALNLDHTIMLKLDISKKIMSTDQTDYTALQQLQTTRWMLPMILQEWSAQDGSADYVQVTLSSELDNVANMYWFYKPQDAEGKTTIAATKINSGEVESKWSDANAEALVNKLTDYEEVSSYERNASNPVQMTRSILYNKHPDIKDRPSNYFYILDDTYPLGNTARKTNKAGENADTDSTKKVGETDWDSWMEDALGATGGSFDAAYDNVVQTAASYDSSDPSTVQQNYGYLWTTQNPLHYFYFVTKESMDEEYTLQDLYNVLQGDFVLNKRTGEEDLMRSDLLYMPVKYNEDGTVVADTTLTSYGNPTGSEAEAVEPDISDTGNSDIAATEDGTNKVQEAYLNQNGWDYSASKDVLDLNHLFNNVVPYLYEMTLITGGTDGTDGLLGDDIISQSEYPVYKGNLKSWLFRSNWAIKIAESSTFNREEIIRDAEGNKYKVTTLWDPKAYPDERPMVFSRAQQMLSGLDDSDLQQFELKCIELNEKVADDWIRMINYINLEGMTTEVMYREMAVVALLDFNKEFSPSALGSNFILYPYTMDIRYISFDSVMRMLMLNVSKNTQYIYNDTMQTVINNSDIFTAILLLIAAMLCSGVIPFLRDIIMAMIFYLGLIAMVIQIFRVTKQKVKLSSGIVLCNVVLMVMTAAYYMIFGAMIGKTTADSVIDLGNASITVGTPLWCFLVVIIVQILYIALMIKFGIFIWQNRGDMGFEAFAEIAHAATDKFNGAIETVGMKLSDIFNGGSDSSGAGRGQAKAKDMSGSGSGADQKASGNTENVQIVADKSNKTRKQDDDSEEMRDLDQTNYQYTTREEQNRAFIDSEKIDAEVDKGRRMEDSAQKK